MSQVVQRKNSCYCVNFRRAANTLTKYYDLALAPLKLTVSQFSLLADIDHLKYCNKSELAQCARLDRTTIIRNLGVLREKGLVEELPGRDNKNKVVRLTPAGKAVFAEGLAYWEKVQADIKKVIGGESVAVLRQILSGIEGLESSMP